MGYGMVEQHLAKFVELGMMGHVESSHGLRAVPDPGSDGRVLPGPPAPQLLPAASSSLPLVLLSQQQACGGPCAAHVVLTTCAAVRLLSQFHATHAATRSILNLC